MGLVRALELVCHGVEKAAGVRRVAPRRARCCNIAPPPYHNDVTAYHMCPINSQLTTRYRAALQRDAHLPIRQPVALIGAAYLAFNSGTIAYYLSIGSRCTPLCAGRDGHIQPWSKQGV